MGGEDGKQALPGVQYIYMSLQGIYAVGIQNHRKAHLPQELADHGADAVPPAQAGPNQAHAAGRAVLQSALRGLQGELTLLPGGQGVGHGLLQLGGHDTPGGLRNPYGHQPRPGAHSRTGRKDRSSGIAHTAPQDINLAKIPLVGVPGPVWEVNISPVHRLDRAVYTGSQMVRDTNWRCDEPPGVESSLAHIMPRFGTGEGHSRRRPDRLPQNAAGVGLHTAGDIGGNHRHAAAVHQGHRRQGVPL